VSFTCVLSLPAPQLRPFFPPLVLLPAQAPRESPTSLERFSPQALTSPAVCSFLQRELSPFFLSASANHSSLPNSPPPKRFLPFSFGSQFYPPPLHPDALALLAYLSSFPPPRESMLSFFPIPRSGLFFDPPFFCSPFSQSLFGVTMRTTYSILFGPFLRISLFHFTGLGISPFPFYPRRPFLRQMQLMFNRLGWLWKGNLFLL